MVKRAALPYVFVLRSLALKNGTADHKIVFAR
jgi:hypothetical protein